MVARVLKSLFLPIPLLAIRLYPIKVWVQIFLFVCTVILRKILSSLWHQFLLHQNFSYFPGRSYHRRLLIISVYLGSGDIIAMVWVDRGAPIKLSNMAWVLRQQIRHSNIVLLLIWNLLLLPNFTNSILIFMFFVCFKIDL